MVSLELNTKRQQLIFANSNLHLNTSTKNLVETKKSTFLHIQTLLVFKSLNSKKNKIHTQSCFFSPNLIQKPIQNIVKMCDYIIHLSSSIKKLMRIV